MTAKAFMVDQRDFIPIELILAALSKEDRLKVYRMLGEGSLHSRGRTLLKDDSYGQSGMGSVFDIPVESWIDADDQDRWKEDIPSGRKFQLQGLHQDCVIVDVLFYNTEKLRQLVNYEPPSISVDEYDERLFKSTNTKMGSKIWGRAAAALASGHVEPSAKKIANYLLDQEDIWPAGKLDEANLRRHLKHLVTEYRKLTGSE